MASIITLTTDFGLGSQYVAAVKGVILSINSAANLVDLSHAIPPQDVRQGALALADAAHWFPPDTTHVAVVDPGVGTDRRILFARFGDQNYIAPDNGLLSGLARTGRPTMLIELARPEFWLPNVSPTFHGRDIMAPVAARISLGLDPAELGPPIGDLVLLDWPEVRVVPGKIDGAVQSIDSFGNLVTDITSDMLAAAPTDESVSITCDEHQTQGIFRTYADQPPMTLIALVGSSGRLELAIVDDSASIMLGIRVGEKVTVTW